MTPSGIEPATFRFVAQHLNHSATAAPYLQIIILLIIIIIIIHILLNNRKFPGSNPDILYPAIREIMEI